MSTPAAAGGCTAAEAETKALRIAGIDPAAIDSNRLFETTVVSLDSAGAMPVDVWSSFPDESLWKVSVGDVPVHWQHDNPDPTPVGLRTISVYIGRNSGQFLKAEITPRQGCTAPLDAWNWPSPRYKLLDANYQSRVTPVDPVPDENALSVISEFSRDDPLVPCIIEVFSLSFTWVGFREPTLSQPPDSTPVWGMVYKYYDEPASASGDTDSIAEDQPDVHLTIWAVSPHAHWRSLVYRITPPWLRR